jgi:putative ABC transport system ATP-binding protein
MTAALAVESVCVTYGRGVAAVRALNNVSLSFFPGRLTLVMGPSGSGKTTLLSVLGCLLFPDRGAVTIMGEPLTAISKNAASRLRAGYLGYVFQAFRLFRSLSALENVMMAAEIAGYPHIEARDRARRCLQALGLERKTGLRPSELSGGEKQRVAIARAIVNDPAIVLADEPTASLDQAAGRQITDILERIATSDGRTVVVVTHDPRWVRAGCRVVTMSDGTVTGDEIK